MTRLCLYVAAVLFLGNTYSLSAALTRAARAQCTIDGRRMLSSMSKEQRLEVFRKQHGVLLENGPVHKFGLLFGHPVVLAQPVDGYASAPKYMSWQEFILQCESFSRELRRATDEETKTKKELRYKLDRLEYPPYNTLVQTGRGASRR